MITIFRTGEFDYKDAGINKPVKFDVDNLIEIASRTSEINVTKEHSSEVIDVMSNFIVEDGLLKAKEPNNLELEGMGFSPVLDFDLIDMGDYLLQADLFQCINLLINKLSNFPHTSKRSFAKYSQTLLV